MHQGSPADRDSRLVSLTVKALNIKIHSINCEGQVVHLYYVQLLFVCVWLAEQRSRCDKQMHYLMSQFK
jgi:hypothetical protein